MNKAHLFTLKSRNAKTGPIPVTSSPQTDCAVSCLFMGNGCYAEQGNVGMLFRNLTATKAGESFKNGRANVRTLAYDDMVAKIAALPENTFWRHNQMGDLKSDGRKIDAKALRRLVDANKGKRGFTYTHHTPTPHNLKAVKSANDNGFTINLSANNPTHADMLAQTGLPIVTVLPIEQTTNTTTPKGRKIVVCPATIRDDVTCSKCKLCAIKNRDFIVGFPAHGAAKNKASNVAKQG